jgi:hypothetical protein
MNRARRLFGTGRNPHDGGLTTAAGAARASTSEPRQVPPISQARARVRKEEKVEENAEKS